MNLQTLQEELSAQGKQQLNGGANRARVRHMADDDRLTDTIPAFRVNDEVSKVVRGIVKTDRRTISDVARALLERGVAAYQRDTQLFEPPAGNEAEGTDNSGTDKPSRISVTTKNLGGRKGEKKREVS